MAGFCVRIKLDERQKACGEQKCEAGPYGLKVRAVTRESREPRPARSWARSGLAGQGSHTNQDTLRTVRVVLVANEVVRVLTCR